MLLPLSLFIIHSPYMADVFDEFKNGNIETVKKWLDDPNNDVTVCDSNGFSLVHWACQRGCLELFKYLQQLGTLFYSLTNTNDTPLHLAVSFGRTDIVRELLRMRVPFDYQNCIGNTPLHYACFWNREEIAEILVRSGVDVTIKNNNGQSPLEIAPIDLCEKLEAILELLGDTPCELLPPPCIENGVGLPLAKNLCVIKIPRSFQYSDVTKQKLVSYNINGSFWTGTYKSATIGIKEVKWFNKNYINVDSTEFYEKILRLQARSHPNIVPISAMMKMEKSLYLLTPWCSNGSLHDFLDNSGKKLSYNSIISLAVDISFGMKFLHSIHPTPPPIHLNSYNILLSASFSAKINLADLDLQFKSRLKFINTIYMTKEELTCKPGEYSHELANIWSFSLILYELFQSKSIDNNLNNSLVAIHKINNTFKLEPTLYHEPRIVKIHNMCLNPILTKRPNFGQICPILRKMKEHLTA